MGNVLRRIEFEKLTSKYGIVFTSFGYKIWTDWVEISYVGTWNLVLLLMLRFFEARKILWFLGMKLKYFFNFFLGWNPKIKKNPRYHFCIPVLVHLFVHYLFALFSKLNHSSSRGTLFSVKIGRAWRYSDVIFGLPLELYPSNFARGYKIDARMVAPSCKLLALFVFELF